MNTPIFIKLHPNENDERIININQVLYVRIRENAHYIDITLDGEEWLQTFSTVEEFEKLILQ